MDKKKIKELIKNILIIVGIMLFIYICFSQEKNTELISEYEPNREDILNSENDELERQNEEYKEEISHLQSRIEELESLYEDTESLVDILREQLESYGIEPYDL